jgi:hypothetical protein
MSIKEKNIANVLIDEILFSPSIVMSIAKVETFFNIQKEHSHSIIDSNGPQKNQLNVL